MRRATTVGLLMRHCANVLVAAIGVLDPSPTAAGRWLLVVVGLWSLYRIVTRSPRRLVLAVDYVLVAAVCLAIPLLTVTADLGTRNTVPVAIAGTSVIGFTIASPARVTLPLTIGVATAFALGSANLVGWSHVSSIFNLYYFAMQWTTIALIRMLLLRVAAAVDDARRHRQSAELEQQVNTAVRDYQRDQLALLHDTAASTLLMVGQGAPLPPHRLAAQARHDLRLLRGKPWDSKASRIEIVTALRQSADFLTTSVEFAGVSSLWLDGDLASSVIAAAREAMNNVEHHANARLLTITVSADAIVLADNGDGFDTDAPTSGHGVRESIAGRMRRAGGHATVDSAPGAGTRIMLSWAAARGRTESPPPPTDPDRLIQRSRVRYGLALSAYAGTNLLLMAPYAVMRGDQPAAQVTLAGVALIATVSAVPGIQRRQWRYRPLAILALLVITVIQPLLLPSNELGSQHYWAQGAIGWCLLPLLLELSVPAASALLLLAWLLGSAVELWGAPSAAHWINIGLGTASILGVQLFALAFSALMRDAAADALTETDARQRLEKRERVAHALRAEYQNRYAALMQSVIPLLDELSRGNAADHDLQRRARAQSRQLRVLFDQAATFDHVLMQQLRPLTDDATARGIDTAVDVIGELPPLSDADIAQLLTPLARLLDAATSTAKLVVHTESGAVTASVVCDHLTDIERLTSQLDTSAADTDLVIADDTAWLLVRHSLTQ